MVKLLSEDIQTREVLDWKGVHLFHFMGSSCSQKTRIFLNLKNIPWESHLVNIGANEHFTPYYLGINPRGLVPTCVMDGEVHIESNDIIQELERRFPETPLIPEGLETKISELLHHEDDLHLDLRTITFRYTQPRGKNPRPPEALEEYKKNGSGTVGGKEDPHKKVEIDFWETAASDGITDKAIQTSAARFRKALEELDAQLSNNPYLLGDNLSILDIAWFVYVFRLIRCGYPIERLHPKVYAWFNVLNARPEFSKEIGVPPDVQKAAEENHRQQAEAHTTLIEVAGL